MKSQLKKLTAIFLSICVVLSLTSVISFAADTTATLTFDANKSNRTSYSTSKQVWEQNGITFTNNKAKSTSNVADYGAPVRLYASSEIIVEYPQMVKIEFTASSTTYASDLKTSIGSTATVSGSKVTVEFSSAQDSFTVTLSKQVRLNSLTVTISEAAAACEHTNTTEERTETTVDALGSVVVTCDDCGKEISNETLGADVTYVVPKGETAPEGETDVTKVTLPEPNALPAEYADTYEFAGWAKADFEATTIEPDVIAAGTEVDLTGHTTFYAVYTYSATATSGVKEYVLTDVANIDATDKVVVTMTYTDGTVYTLGNNKGTGSAPGAETVEVTGNKITSEVKNTMLWNIANSNGSLTFYPDGTTATWLYCTSTNNGVRVGTNVAKVFTIDGSSGYIKHTGTGRFVGVYRTNPDWRCYTSTTTNISGQTLGFYVETATAGTVTYYTTSLGSVDGASVDVGSDLTMNFYVDDEKLTAPKMTFTMDGETVTVETKNAEGAFAFEGVPPHCMTEIITANLYDGDKLVATKEYSVQKNIQDLLNGGALTADQKQFVSNMLHYGDAAQNYKGNNDVLATEGVENLLAATTELPTKSDVAISGTVTDVAYFKSANVWFDNVNKLIVKFNELPENAKLLVNGTEVSFDGVSYMTDGILASDFGKIYNFTIANEQGEELQTLTYSVNSYVYAKKDSATMQELVTALYNYGLYAEKLV